MTKKKITAVLGPTNTGKTFLAMKFLRQVETYGLCWTVAAPTHKAVGVLRQSLLSEGIKPTWLITGIFSSVISFIHLQLFAV